MRGKIVALGLLTCTSTFAFELQYSLKSFLWEEYDSKGNKLLKESGFLHEFGATHRFDTDVLYIKPYGGIEIGSVNYDGHTQEGTPVETDTNYWGVKTRLVVGKEFGLLYGEAGTGYDYWKRNLETTGEAIGYTETWSQWYIPLRLGFKSSEGNIEFWGFGEYRINLKTTNEPSLASVTLKPKSKLYFSIGGGIKISRIILEILYSYDKWKKSDSEYYSEGVKVYEVWQPESKRQVIQFTVGYQF